MLLKRLLDWLVVIDSYDNALNVRLVGSRLLQNCSIAEPLAAQLLRHTAKVSHNPVALLGKLASLHAGCQFAA